MKLVRIICPEEIDFKMSAPPMSRMHGFCDICVGGFTAFSAFFLSLPSHWVWRAEVFLDCVVEGMGSRRLL